MKAGQSRREARRLTADSVIALVTQLETVEYAFLIVAGTIAVAMALVARARRRDRHDRDELRAHVRSLGGPSDPGG
jgi:hypothetical protein